MPEIVYDRIMYRGINFVRSHRSRLESGLFASFGMAAVHGIEAAFTTQRAYRGI
jgi:hypothetical protein